MSSLSFVSSSIVYYLVFKVHYQPLLFWWAQVDSNHRPHAYQACALTTWAMSPQKVVEISGIEPLTSCVQGRRSPSWAKPPSFTTVSLFWVSFSRTLKIKQFLRTKTRYVIALVSQSHGLLRKEVIQPHLPIRLPCYDFTPITSFTFGHALLLRLGYGLRVPPALMVWRAVCTRPGNVFTAACWSAITSNSGFM